MFNDFVMHRCRHLSLSGARCTTPSQPNKDFCFEHNHRRHLARKRRAPVLPDPTDVRAPLVSFAYMDDLYSVMNNLNAIAQAFALSKIDHRQVSSLTYLMNTAIKTLDRIREAEPLPKQDPVQDVVYDEFDEPIAAPDPTPAAADPQPPTTPEPEPNPISAPAPVPEAREVSEAEPESAPHAVQFTNLCEKSRELDPPDPPPFQYNPEAGAILDPIANEATEENCEEDPANPCFSSNLPLMLTASREESNTWDLRPSRTTADSTLTN